MARVRRPADAVDLTVLSPKARRMLEAAKLQAESKGNPMFTKLYIHAMEQYLANKNRKYLEFIRTLRTLPVDIETFLDSDQFLGATDLTLWPEVRKAVIEINQDWWKGPKYAKVESLLMGACVDQDTEFLTPDGWKKISDYEEGDQVAEYIPTSDTTGRVEYVTPSKYVKLPCDEFIHFASRGGVDQKLTPGHIVPYVSQKGNLNFKYAKDVEASQHRAKDGWRGSFLTTFTPEIDTALPLSDVEIRIMVAAMADGAFQKHVPESTRCRMVFKKERKITRFQNLMDQWGGEYVRKDRGDGYTEFTFYAPERNKTYKGWYAASVEQLQVVCNEVLFWDGSIRHQQFYTAEKESADFIQYAFSATGVRATLQQQDRGGNRSTEYRVKACKKPTISMSGSHGQKTIPERVQSEDGYCYCFTMPRTKMWVARRNGAVFITHNTSTGKSEISKVTTAYHMHLLGCMKDPQKYYGLPTATEIVFAIQAAKPHVTKRVIYTPLRNYVETMPWFQRYMRPNKLIESEMYFDEINLRVVPGGSDTDTILGDAIIGGVIDEINFMNVVEKSKKAGVGTGRSATYDQAKSIYDAITRRKKGRFLSNGPQVGVICIASSTRYKGDFTDKRKAQVQESNTRTVYVYDKKQYEVWPQDRYSGEKFYLHIGSDAAMDISIVEDESNLPKTGTLLEVPIEYKEDFEKDAPGSLRDVCGMSANSVNPFIRQPHKVMECVALGEETGLASFLHKDNVVLAYESLPMPITGHFCRNPGKPRYVHIDLSVTGDRCGVAMVRFDGMQYVDRSTGIRELLPLATVEMAVTIEPDTSNEIDIAEVRSWVKLLKSKYGYPIKAVTYDGWNCVSEDTRIWTDRGLVYARDIAEGDKVQTRIGPRPVLKKWEYGLAPTTVVTTQHGHTIEVTGKHKLEVLDKWIYVKGRRIPKWCWKKADSIEIGTIIRRWEECSRVDRADYVPLGYSGEYGNSKYFTQPTMLTEEVAAFIGLLHGDGSFQKKKVGIHVHEDEAESVLEFCQSVFGFDNNLKATRDRESKGCTISIDNQEFRNWLSINGLDGKYTVPPKIRESGLSVQAAFISGLLSADGSIKERDGQVSIETVSKEYAEYITDIACMGYGLPTNIAVRKGRETELPQGGTAVVDSFIVSFAGSRHNFLDCIGFSHGPKQEKMEEYAAVEGRRIFSKVIDKQDSMANVVDFEVQDDHCYLANGFVSHNSRESIQAWKKQGMKTGQVSVDRSSTPYKQFREALNDLRIRMYHQEIVIGELLGLEYDEKKDKIDHPVNGSKDGADAVCGAYHTMLSRASSWVLSDGDRQGDDASEDRQDLGPRMGVGLEGRL